MLLLLHEAIERVDELAAIQVMDNDDAISDCDMSLIAGMGGGVIAHVSQRDGCMAGGGREPSDVGVASMDCGHVLRRLRVSCLPTSWTARKYA